MKETSGGGGSNVHEKLSQENNYPTQSMEGLAQPMPMSINVHENGKVKKVMGKLEEKEAKLGKSSVEKPVAKPDVMEDKQGKTAHNHVALDVKASSQAPNLVSNLNNAGPMLEGKELGPIAMCFDENKGWISETLGPTSRHWKRLAWEVHNKVAQIEGDPINGKRAGLTPLQELDPNISELKCRRGSTGQSKKKNGEEQTVGGVAVATM